jgi:hypothetical protein
MLTCEEKIENDYDDQKRGQADCIVRRITHEQLM